MGLSTAPASQSGPLPALTQWPLEPRAVPKSSTYSGQGGVQKRHIWRPSSLPRSTNTHCRSSSGSTWPGAAAAAPRSQPEGQLNGPALAGVEEQESGPAPVRNWETVPPEPPARPGPPQPRGPPPVHPPAHPRTAEPAALSLRAGRRSSESAQPEPDHLEGCPGNRDRQEQRGPRPPPAHGLIRWWPGTVQR